MGQAIRKLRSKSQHFLPSLSKASMQLRPPLRQSLEVKPTPPEPHPIVEPMQNLVGWDYSDPKYAAMVRQVVGRITTRPGGKPEMGEAEITAEYRRPKPVNRHTSAATGPDDDIPVNPGTLNLRQLRELFLLYQGQADGQEKPLDFETLAKKYKLDVVLVEKMLRHTALPTVILSASEERESFKENERISQ
ncbi:hypothetical protein O6H91_06G145900 [Diphasiastrum complanatum]|uniref:Uncharacterized protein n=1 Tax=Diphasiastrum complanatum TaxID=34168 RepID=A0ACC2DKB7_DIPCM|nr:hypothetical protein O6H91_06G145900 [Diphasiastrum complanatum]